jgi:peroxiredoxin
MGTDRQGRLYIVWYTEGPDEMPAVYLAYSDDQGRTFSEKRKLNIAKNTFPDHPQVAVDPAGRVVVIWEEQGPVKRDVVMSLSMDRGQSFSAPLRINERKTQEPDAGCGGQHARRICDGLDGTRHAGAQAGGTNSARPGGDGGCREGATAVTFPAVQRNFVSRTGQLGCALLVVVLNLPASAVAVEDPLAAMRVGRAPTGTAAAPFDLHTLDGRSVQLKDLAGKVVVLNFWATWCGPCKDEMPALERLRKKIDPSRVVLLTVTTDRQRDGIKHFMTNLDVRVPVLFDEDQEVSQAYMVRALPTTVIIDPKGTVVGRAVGPREWDAPEAVRLMQQLAEGRE